MSVEKKDLSKYDIVVAIDKSGSMLDPQTAGGTQTRWAAAQEAASALVHEAVKYDDDGITVFMFSSDCQEFKNINDGEAKVREIFNTVEPRGSTKTDLLIKMIGDDYFARKAANPSETKPMIVLVLTDGIPDDEKALQAEITSIANKVQSDEEFGIQFIQVGDNAHAHEFLKKLDENLQGHGAKFDIVDTMTTKEMDGKALADVLIEALTD